MFNVQKKKQCDNSNKKKHLKMKKKPMMSQNVEKSPFTKSVKYVSKTLKKRHKSVKK